jgi:hypothetical protein
MPVSFKGVHFPQDIILMGVRWYVRIRRTVAAEIPSTTPSAMSWRASSVQSHWERLRPSESGRSQARRTTWIATSGGKTTLGTAARGVGEPVQALRQKAFGPLADHRPLDSHGASHIGVGVPSGQ